MKNNDKIDNGAKNAPTEKEVLIGDVVFVFDGEDKEENFDNIQSFQQVLALDAKKPNLLIRVKPPLYSAFKSKDKNIEPYVKLDDEVVFKNPAFSPDKENPTRTILNVYPKSLGSMSVIVADFYDGDYALTNHLKVIQ